MNCCDDFSNCTRGKDCPARPAMVEVPQPTAPMLDLADRARHMAAEAFYEPNYGRAQLVQKRPAYIKHLDWIGNLPHRIGRWVDRSPALQMAVFAIGAIAACALVALTIFHK